MQFTVKRLNSLYRKKHRIEEKLEELEKELTVTKLEIKQVRRKLE